MELIIILFTLLILLNLINVIFILRYNIEEKNKKSKKEEKENIELLKILLEPDSLNKIDTSLDQFIYNAGNNYTLFKLSQKENHYITEEDQNEMIMYIFASVKKNMTKEMRRLIGLVHVINSEQDLDNLIQLRTKMYMLNFVVDYNKPLEDGSYLP